ncbi:MAG: hypothetical protein WC438_03300 [Candidatus Pacearchaeota archaeon]
MTKFKVLGNPDLFAAEHKAFPELEKLANDFCEHNNLEQPCRTTETHAGLILNWRDNSQVILSSEFSSPYNPNIAQRKIGGSGLYNSKEVEYRLSGELTHKNIRLKAKVSFVRSYIEAQQGLKEDREPQIHIFREDNQPYWFLEKQRK